MRAGRAATRRPARASTGDRRSSERSSRQSESASCSPPGTAREMFSRQSKNRSSRCGMASCASSAAGRRPRTRRRARRIRLRARSSFRTTVTGDALTPVRIASASAASSSFVGRISTAPSSAWADATLGYSKTVPLPIGGKIADSGTSGQGRSSPLSARRTVSLRCWDALPDFLT